MAWTTITINRIDGGRRIRIEQRLDDGTVAATELAVMDLAPPGSDLERGLLGHDILSVVGQLWQGNPRYVKRTKPRKRKAK